MMASAMPTTTITHEERRWLVIGLCLAKVLTPALRNIVATEIPKWHQVLCRPPTEIDKQVYGRHEKQLNPSTMDLNYKNINNNNVNRSPRLFDYAVKDPLSLAKLFVLPFMSKFTGFDQTMDISAILSVICEAAPFTAAAAHAKIVRSDIRNEWAHCNFANWTEARFTAAFFCMETLLKNVNLSPEEEQQMCDDLNNWKDKGLKCCFRSQPVDIHTPSLLLEESVHELRLSVQTLNLEENQVSTVLLNIDKIQSKLRKEIDELRGHVKRIEIQANDNYREIELLKGERSFGQLARYIIEKEELPYVFSAPGRNRYFAGRIEEIEELKRILKVEQTSNEKKVRVAAVCGLGGIGKTSLVTEYAHQMKDFYQGGVYWFSAEDDKFLDQSVNDIASKIVSDNSFNSNLAFVLRKISTTNDPCLIVLDCLDQLELSSNMMEFLSFPSHTSICGHFVVITRRNPGRLLNEVSVFDDQCFLQLKCFQRQEATQFLFSRSGITYDENLDSDAECLCEELERLPLALEQVGASIKMLKCSFSSYLEQYKDERLRLLEQQKGRPVAPGKESLKRIAVHTTWRINMEHIKKSSNGEEAVRFLNACAFFNRNEIEEELINVGKPEVEGVSYRRCVSSPLGSRQILKLLTDFSLFKYVDENSKSVSTHRLVQELVKDSLDLESKAKSITDAVRMLSFAFAKCSSPGQFVMVMENNPEEQNIAFPDFQQHSSPFYMWSKFCMHGHNLCRSMEDLLETPVFLDPLWFPETAKIFYECAVHLSANRKQKEAKRALNFGYRILDWLPSKECESIKSDISNNSLFPLRIPLPKSFQTEINRFCSPPLAGHPALPEQTATAEDELDAKSRSKKSKKDGSKGFEEVCGGIRNSSTGDLTSKIQWKNLSSEDVNDKLTRSSDWWKGFAEVALALKDSGENICAEIAAALAFYHNPDIFSGDSPFKNTFLDLQDRIFICNSVDKLREAIYWDELQDDELKFLLLGSPEYILNVPTFAQPWNNCVLVGTRKRCSVTLELDGSIDVLKCMLVNLSFVFYEGRLNCLPESFVKLLGCKFTSNGEDTDAVTTSGDLNAEQCCFEYSKGCGLSCLEQGRVVVADSFFRGNGKHGLLVQSQNRSKLCVVRKCDIHHNLQNGIDVSDAKICTNMYKNNIYCNGHSGVRIHRCDAEIKENDIFVNDTWGVFQSGGNSIDCDISVNISMNRIFRNNCGGIRLGYKQKKGKTVVEKNEIYDNNGPGYVNDVNNSQYQDNNLSNNMESENVGELDFSVPFCSNCHKRTVRNLNSCGKCFTAAYCNETCQKNHFSKHKTICEDLREKSSYLITSMEPPKTDISMLRGREFGPPPQDETRFIVQVFNILTGDKVENTIILNDRSLERPLQFNSIAITELIREFGVLRERKNSEKDLFLYCINESDDQLRLITNQFAE
ncbi:uncharacterized protein LOC114516987 [Dendronephthya gigantea]|uniref:uncharacterized protein LOC114516987 n=1 Tax=Dendronephthya gigantea TaxID=151771 RepID=UPI00106C7B1B|nr:uncharacterized protein LOC114516987 [Dendronephthya gigantea]